MSKCPRCGKRDIDVWYSEKHLSDICNDCSGLFGSNLEIMRELNSIPDKTNCSTCGTNDSFEDFEIHEGNWYCKACYNRQPVVVYDSEKEDSAFEVQEGGNHYKNFKIQPTEYSHKNGLDWCQGNVVKYVTRHKIKNGIEDIKKAIHYLQFIAEMDYGEKL